MHAPTVFTVAAGVMLAACSDNLPTPPSPASPTAAAYPPIVALPTGFAPEGMAFGRGSTAYVGSLLTGAIWCGDVRTGNGRLLVPETPGRSATGIKYDQRGDRIFVAGGMTGQAYVYDASSGATLAVYQLADPSLVEAGLTLVNDVVLLGDAAYFTDSFRAVIYRVPLGASGKLPASAAVQTIPVTGDYNLLPDGAFNGTGIAATPDDRKLILMNSQEGVLYLVDPKSGRATRMAVDRALPFGDGILLDGHTLYVVQADPDQVTVVHLSPDYTSGTVERVITDPKFAFPTAVGAFGNALYVLNGRFDVAPPGVPAPDVDFQLVRVTR
jgi:DNA-binding beta-propeller fold protein YncE